MKLKILFVISFLALSVTAWTKPEIKMPDTYAFNRGIEAYNEEKYADALDWFDRELSEHPDNGYAYVYISTICFGKQEYGKALSAMDNALKRLPKKDKKWRSGTYASRSEVYTALGDTARAFDDLAQAIRIDPSNPRFYKERAQLYYEQANYSLSDTDYQKMIDLDQGDVMGYMGKGRNANAQAHWDEAIKQFDMATKLHPEYSSGYSFRAEAYAGQEKWAQATDDIVTALNINGDNKAFYMMQTLPQEALRLIKPKLKIQMTKQPTNNYWPYCIAVIADAKNEPEEAIDYYEKAHAIDANSVFMENIAKCYFGKQEYAKALDYADRALAMSPDDYDVVNLKADILSFLGRYEECLIERDRYVAQFPDDPFAYFSRGDDRLNARHFEEAIDDYNTAIVLTPSFAEQPFFLLRRGDAYRLTGKSDEAVKDYEQLLKIESDTTLSAASWTPFAYSGLGNAEKAIETAQYILENDTTDILGTLYNTACIYGRLAMTAEAIRYLNEAIEKGYVNFNHIETDYDLDCIRTLPEYQRLMEKGATNADSIDIHATNEPVKYNTEIVEVPFTKESGVTMVRCSINGLPLHFVFDTGAADVTMSMVEANFMLKNDYIQPADIVGSARYMDANGDITEGTIVNLRTVNFGGLELNNVRASVVRNQKAPLLLGQSVLGRLGKIEIDNPGMKLVITHKVSR